MQLTPYNPNEAIKALQDMINSWLAENPKRSKTSLARDAGVAESTIRRVMNDGTLPLAHNISKIVSVIKGASTNKEIVEAGGPLLSKVIAFHLPYKTFDTSSNYVNLGPEVEQLLNNSTKKLIFIKANACCGLNKQELQKDFGQLGVVFATEMTNADLLRLVDDIYYVPDKYKDISFSPSASKENILSGISLYYKSEIETNYSFNVVDKVSVKGFNRAMDILEEAHRKIEQIVKEDKGHIPLFVASVMDTMTTDNYFNKDGDL